MVFHHPPTAQVRSSRVFRKISSNKNSFNESIAAFFSQIYYLALQLFSVKRRNKGSLLLLTFNHLQPNVHKVDTPDPIFSSCLLRQDIFLISLLIPFVSVSHFSPSLSVAVSSTSGEGGPSLPFREEGKKKQPN